MRKKLVVAKVPTWDVFLPLPVGTKVRFIHKSCTCKSSKGNCDGCPVFGVFGERGVIEEVVNWEDYGKGMDKGAFKIPFVEGEHLYKVNFKRASQYLRGIELEVLV